MVVVEVVAPLVGAWIEIKENSLYIRQCKSLPLWERGLKYHLYYLLL